MIKLHYSPAAHRDLQGIGHYIKHKLQNPTAARNTLQKIRKDVESLRRFPEMGPLLDQDHFPYRCLTSGNYLIFYHVLESSVSIDRVIYGRRDYISLLFGEESGQDMEQ